MNLFNHPYSFRNILVVTSPIALTFSTIGLLAPNLFQFVLKYYSRIFFVSELYPIIFNKCEVRLDCEEGISEKGKSCKRKPLADPPWNGSLQKVPSEL